MEKRKIVGILLVLGGCASTTTTSSEVRRMGQRGETQGLFDAWQDASTDAIRVAVIESFADNASNRAGQRLVVEQAKRARARPVQIAALRALSAYSGEVVIGALVVGLGHSWPEAREVARAGLSVQGPAAHGPLLVAAAGDANPWVRAGASKLLIRAALVHAPLRSAVQDSLLSLLSDKVARVRETAAEGLGRLKVASAREQLGDLARTDPDSQVRLRCAEAIRALGLGSAGASKRAIVAVLPLKDDTGGGDPAVARLTQQIADYIAARLSASKVCTVVDQSKLNAALAEMRKVGKAIYDGDSPNAPEIGEFKLANQLVYGSIQLQGGVYTIVLKRMDVSTLALVPGAAVTVSGRRADLEQLKKEAADRLVRRFN